MSGRFHGNGFGMRKLLLLTLLGLSACKGHQSASNVRNFFENSRRRLATADELKPLARVGGCAGFFVHNNQNKNIVGTARHCVNYKMTDWCENNGAISAADGTDSGHCKRIVAGDSLHDIVLVETDMRPRDAASTLVLAGYMPAKNIRLKMIGFPVDPYASGGLRAYVSENCWVNRERFASASSITTDGTPDEEANALVQSLAGHNCSTYGGDSGGPMLKEGTRQIVGEPFSYVYQDYINMGYRASGTMALMGEFVSKFRAILVREGITIADVDGGNLPLDKANPGYFQASTYTSPGIPGCNFVVVPQYYTGPDIRGLRVVFESATGSCSGTDTYTCTSGRCVGARNRDVIESIDVTGFTYRHYPEMSSTRFSR